MDTEILVNNYGKKSYAEIATMLSVQKDADYVKRRAIYIGLTSSRQWTEEDIKILIENYSTKPMSEVMELLSNHSLSSIMGQAKTQQIKSYYYLSRKYTEDEDDYLRNNYLILTNKELANHLGRSQGAIEQRILILGLQRPTDISSYHDLSTYTRKRILPWKNKVRADAGYTCAITGARSNIIVHHIRGFNLLFNETIENLDFPIYEDICQYTQSQLDCFVASFLELQELYGEYICITENIHKEFHSQYGYGYNTKEQWEEFINKNYK